MKQSGDAGSTEDLHADVPAMRVLLSIYRQCWRRCGLEPFDLDLLYEATGITEWFESPLLHLRTEVSGGNPLVPRSAAAAIQRVAREKRHVASDRDFGNRRDRCVGTRWRVQGAARSQKDDNPKANPNAKSDAWFHGGEMLVGNTRRVESTTSFVERPHRRSRWSRPTSETCSV